MLLIKVALLALSVLPASIAKRHHRSASTLTTQTSTTNTTTPITTMSAGAGARRTECPTITTTVEKTFGVCPDSAKEKRYACAPLDFGVPVTSTFHVGCSCPAATPTSTLSMCMNVAGCERSTDWVYATSVGCNMAD